MKIKKYISNSFHEGKAKIYKELGENAVILSSRNIKSASDGKEVIEIVAALDESESKKSTKSELSGKHLVSAERRIANVSTSAENESILDALNELKDLVRFKQSASLSAVNAAFYKSLLKAEISEDEALKIVNRISSQFQDLSLSEMITEARKLLVSDIEIVPQLKPGTGRQIIYFFGPSGSGKTSTLVKLALVCKLVHNADILLVSADTEKVGGAEQLQTYASIASIPFRAVYSGDEIESLLHAETSRDYIFIDTTGYNPSVKENIAKLEQLLVKSYKTLKYLILSATDSYSFLDNSISAYARLGVNSYIFTKIDEVVRLGSAYSVIKKHNLKLSYFTTGQKIPDDIEPASKSKLSKIILPDELLINSRA